jgi:hypothetical protein
MIMMMQQQSHALPKAITAIPADPGILTATAHILAGTCPASSLRPHKNPNIPAIASIAAKQLILLPQLFLLT